MKRKIMPKKRVMCPACMKQKMMFDSKDKALNFIRFNIGDFKEGTHLRAYYCKACCAWHITSQPYQKGRINNTQRMIDAYNKDINLKI